MDEPRTSGKWLIPLMPIFAAAQVTIILALAAAAMIAWPRSVVEQDPNVIDLTDTVIYVIIHLPGVIPTAVSFVLIATTLLAVLACMLLE